MEYLLNLKDKSMFSIPEQFSTATKTNLEAQLAMINALTSKALEGVAKVTELNVSSAKASWAESVVIAKQLLSTKDPQEFFRLSAAQGQSNMEKALSYGRHLGGLASGIQAEFIKATEPQIVEARRKVTALVDEVTKNAPAGSESAVAILKSSVSNAHAGYEQLTKTTKQAVETLEANLTRFTNQFSPVVEKTVNQTAKK